MVSLVRSCQTVEKSFERIQNEEFFGRSSGVLGKASKVEGRPAPRLFVGLVVSQQDLQRAADRSLGSRECGSDL